MSDTYLLNKYNVSVIEQDEQILNGEKLTYRFYRVSFAEMIKYAIGIEFGDESEVCFSGSEASSSERLFEIVRKNTVTPCTLPYVVEDFFEDLQ